jgi:hypothetical protein
MILLPAINLTLGSTDLGGRPFNVTTLDVAFLVCCAGLLFDRKAVRLAKSTTNRVLWRIAWSGPWLAVILLVLNGIANMLYQPRSYWVASTLTVFRTYCQAFIVPPFFLVFLRGRPALGAGMAVFGFAFLGLADATFRQVQWGVRATPFEMNPNAFGQVLAITIVFALTMYLSKDCSRFVHLICVGGVVAAGLGMIISGSREAVIGAFLGIAFLIPISRREKGLLLSMVRLLLLGLCLIVIYQLTAEFQSRFEPVFGRLETIISGGRLASDENLSLRLELSKEALGYYVDNPIFVLSGRGLPATVFATTLVPDADSAFLNSVSSFGIFGVLAIMLYYWSYWRQAQKLAAGQTNEPVWLNGVKAALITYLSIGLAANVFGSPHTTIIILVVISIVLDSTHPRTSVSAASGDLPAPSIVWPGAPLGVRVHSGRERK